MITEQTNISWLEDESKLIATGTNIERLPNLKLEENKISEVTIDFSKPFQTWNGQDAKGKDVAKAIIPVTHEGVKKHFWLNKKNPLYSALINEGKAGKTVFKILQTGNQQLTKYVLVQN